MPLTPSSVSPGRGCSSRATPESTSTPLRAAAGARAEWRLGYLGQAELELALGAATIAVFPYRAELDQSGALLQALGAGVPAVVYDVGGLGEIVGAFGAGSRRARRRRAGAAEAIRICSTTLTSSRRLAPGLRGHATR